MNKLFLHIGSYKTGTTYIQNTFHNNSAELKRQGFIYPGNEVNHHKLFFSTRSKKEFWPRQFKFIDNDILEVEIRKYFSLLENDLLDSSGNHIISTEYLFIPNKDHISSTINYLKKFFSEIVVIVFIRDPAEYYRSYQQQMIKARSFITSPDLFHYNFRKVIEVWSSFCETKVIEYKKGCDPCRKLCEIMGVDFGSLKRPNDLKNASLSIEQMLLLEKLQKNHYSNAEDIFKPHLGVIHNLNAEFIEKPELLDEAYLTIKKNHYSDLMWLKKQYSIDFTDRDLNHNYNRAFSGNEEVSIREVYKVNEQKAELYESLILNLLLRNIAQQN